MISLWMFIGMILNKQYAPENLRSRAKGWVATWSSGLEHEACLYLFCFCISFFMSTLTFIFPFRFALVVLPSMVVMLIMSGCHKSNLQCPSHRPCMCQSLLGMKIGWVLADQSSPYYTRTWNLNHQYGHDQNRTCILIKGPNQTQTKRAVLGPIEAQILLYQ